MKSIHIITVSDGKLKTLIPTLKSIDSQNFKGVKNFVISKKKIINIKNIYKTKKRFFIHKNNSSIYEAMNHGLIKSKNNHLIFLNSGDIFFSNSSLKIIGQYIKKNPKKCLMFISVLKNNKNYFIPKKKIFFSKNFLTHSSFIRPPNDKDIGFNIKNKITADGDWMKDNIKKFKIKKIYNSVTTFYLGGVSNLPSKRSLKMKINTGVISISKELLKFFLLRLINKSLFYKIIYYFKYDSIQFDKIKKNIDNNI
jgi:hypothetical protein